MASCGELLDTDDRLLSHNVARFLSEGLKRGDGILMIATPQHRTTLTRELRVDAGYSRAVQRTLSAG